MKKLFLAIMLASGIFMFSGCASDKVQVIHTDSKKQQVSAFNDETYVWESFIFTTNRIEKAK